MINIKLLGSVAVSADGAPIGGDAGQRRRLALLAVLAAPPLRSHSRDRLIGLLWPENETESARHLLSASIHVLRKALGSETIVSAGDDVALRAGGVAIDASEFRNALSAGDFAGAVEQYGGTFLDGFYISGAPEFEQWIDGERAEYSAMYRSALSGLAGQHERAGDVQGAVAVWRRLAAADPYNSRVALAYMNALARAGERASAIQHARVFAQLLEQEVGARPDPEVEALAESLRSQPATKAAVAPAATKAAAVPPSAEPDAAAPAAPVPMPLPGSEQPKRWRRWAGMAAVVATALLGWRFIERYREMGTVAVLPMPVDSTGEYWSEIGEYILDRLAQVDRLHTVPSTSTQALQRKNLDARTIAARLNARYALSVQTGLTHTRDSLRARIELMDARANSLKWSRTYRFALSSVLDAQKEIAHDVIVAIAGRSPAEQAEVQITNNPTAYELYLQGTSQLAQRTPASLERARVLFTQAIERDSAYAMAYARLADTYNMLGGYDYGSLEPRVAYEQARAAAKHAERLDPRLEAPHAALANVSMNYDWDFAEAEREFRAALRLNPRCPSCRQWLGLMLGALGRSTESIAQVDSAILYDPTSPLAFTTRGQLYYYKGDYEAAANSLASALELQSDFNRAHVLLAVVDFQRGRTREAVERLTALLRIQEEPLLLGLLANFHGQLGGRAEAESYYRRLQTVTTERYVPAEYHALASIGMKRFDEAFRHLREAATRHSGGMIYLPVEPLVNPIRSDPRFAELVRATRR